MAGSNNKLNTKERKAKNFIDLAFEPHDGEWMQTSNRLLDAFKGKYFSKTDRKDRYTINTIFSLVNLLLPNFIIQQPYIQAKPLNPQYLRKDALGGIEQINNIQAARTRTAAINHIYSKISAIQEDRKALQDSFFYGFGITKTGYSFETTSSGDKDYVTQDTPFHKRVCPKDFGWHPLATGLDDSIKLVHRLVSTRARLKGNEYFSKSALAELKGEIPKHLKEKLKGYREKDFSEFVTVYEVLDQEEDMYYYYGGEEKLLLGKKERGYHFNGSDYDMVKFAGDNDEFLGIPLLAMVEDQCVALNEIMTMMLEHMRKFPGMVFLEQGAADDDQIEAMRTGEQGSIHIVNNLGEGKIQFKNPLQMGGDYFAFVSLLQNVIDKILGVTDFQRTAGSGRKSATEASYIQGDASVRRLYFLNQVKEFVLGGVKKVASLQAQYQDAEEEIMFSGDMGSFHTKYTKEDLQGDYQFNFDVDNMAFVNQAEATNLTNMLNVVASQPTLQPVIATLNPYKLGKELFKRVNLNIEAFQNEEPENMVFVPADRENELARKGEPMPQPKKGEPHADHIKAHMADLEKNGWNEEIAQHIAATQMLMQQGQAPVTPQVPPPAQATPPGVGQEQGQMMQDMAPTVNEPSQEI